MLEVLVDITRESSATPGPPRWQPQQRSGGLQQDGGGGACSERGGAQAAGADGCGVLWWRGRVPLRRRRRGLAAAMGETEKLYYVYSCDLDINVQLKIGSLEGKREQKSYKALLEDPMLKFSGLYQETCSDLYVTCQVFAEGKPLALPVRTSYKAFSTRWNWNEWLKLPVKYPDLPRNAQVALTIWDVYGPGKAVPVGGTTVSLFGKYGMFRQGMHDLKVWPNVEADGSEPTRTPGRTSSTVSEDQMSRLAKVME
ncbi:PREDICTED: phosphatidylinositol 3-kinase catalytic subunit type 3-like [Leptosomus discolor]|uniref:phosphatidylinositol 3-kinase catalytic subunit type 3-like n=2 Tax=Telluraves TaxID=3073808 RepID=UPI000522640A|nr:PREDICTED: phosphatidylinositol 3-kinase catalytic subunit type 3-like [Leptosomus discolor]